MQQPLTLGIAGLGTVGGGLLHLLKHHKDRLEERAGRPIRIGGVSARSKGKKRGAEIGSLPWFDDPVKLATDPSIDVFVELIGGSSGVAKAAVEAALKAGKHVVTANKALIAEHGTALAKLAEEKRVALNFEAAVAGGIPVIKTLRESLAANEVRRSFERWAQETAAVPFNRRSGEGYLRHLVVREGVRSSELLVMLVTSPGAPPQVERLVELLPAGVVGVLHAQQDSVAETTAGVTPTLLYGRDWFEERIGGLSFHVTIGAFMQTNTIMCERLYAIALEYAEITPEDVVWDLYCGSGAIGLQAAAAGATAVYGIDISAESIVQARENAERNGLATAEFVQGDVSKEVRPLLERVPKPDLLFVDPPRAGLTARAVRRAIELAPQRLVYVSCNPTTLAPNARQLVDAGYVLEKVRPVDMFPHTPHIECVAQFVSGAEPR